MISAVDPAAVSQALQLGGLCLFAGGKDPFKAGPLFLLTDLIDLMSHSHYSHAAIAMPAGSNPPFVYESTIEGQISGPQKNLLSLRLAEYQKEGGHAWIFNFLPQFTPDWGPLETLALQMIALREAGKMPYDVKRLFRDAQEMSDWFRVITLPEAGLIDWMADRSTGVVCSEEGGLLMQGGHVDDKVRAAGIPWLPMVKPPGQPIGDSPADLGAMPIYLPPVMLI